MRILKFGGTSIGTAERIKKLIPLIERKEPLLVVLSAMAGTTNALESICIDLSKDQKSIAAEKIKHLQNKYCQVVKELFDTPEFKQKGDDLIKSHFHYLQGFTIKECTALQEKAILAQGELISSALFHFLLEERKIDSALIPALNYMRIDKDGEPDHYYIQENLHRELDKYPGKGLFITQGYICRNVFGEVDNLKRGGSDFSASLIGVALEAREIEIWTDISGFHNNDPRIVKNTRVIRQLSFDEAAELAYFGARILHPSSVLPCKQHNIPVRLKNTLEPDDPGTLITSKYAEKGIKAVAAKDGIIAIKIKSARMLLAYGFLRKVFEVFEIYRTPIDMITTSEVAVSLTIDDDSRLAEIREELKKSGTVQIDKDQTIICVVGDFRADNKACVLKILEALKDIPIRMISYGGSWYNVSMLVSKEVKVQALQALHEHLFLREN
jgi:aspartate kinase